MDGLEEPNVLLIGGDHPPNLIDPAGSARPFDELSFGKPDWASPSNLRSTQRASVAKTSTWIRWLSARRFTGADLETPGGKFFPPPRGLRRSPRMDSVEVTNSDFEPLSKKPRWSPWICG